MAQKAKFNMEIAANVKGANNIKRLGNNMQGVQGKVKNLSMSMGVLNNAFRIFAGILAAGAFTRFIKGAVDQADAFGKLERQTGVAAETLQSYVNAGKLAGVEQSTIEKGLRRLAQSMREADQGVATYADAYKALGISVRDAQGNLKRSEDLLGEMADTFKGMEDGSTKAAIAMEIFGRSGSQLIPMLNEGSEALKEWNYQTSAEFAQNAEYFNDQLTMIGFGFDGFRKLLTDNALPALNSIAEVFREILSTESEWSGFFKVVNVGLRGLAGFVFATAKLVDELGRSVMDLITIAKKLGKGDFGGITDFGRQSTEDFEDRFAKNMEQLNKIFTGTSNAPESYFAKADGKANSLKMTVVEIKAEMEKTFGENMNTKLVSFGKTLNDFGSLVGNTITKAFKGLEDTLVNFVTTGKLQFKSLVQSIIADLARLTIRKGITQPLFNAFSSSLGSLFGPSVGTELGGMIGGPSAPIPGGLSFGGAKSNGGIVSSPQRVLLGEAGESELVIPASKMDQAMRRYSKGARGSSILEGGDSLGSESGNLVGAGAIDVRFDVQRINAVDYVTAQQFEQGIRSATEQGARKGEQMTLRRLQTSPNTRKRIGV